MRNLCLAFILPMLVQCGPKGPQHSSDTKPESHSVQQHREQQPARNNANSTGGFRLVNADQFVIAVEGCSSGHTATVTEIDPQVRVYKGDHNCLAKLTTFTNSNGTFIPLDGQGFQTYQQGEVATFVNGDFDTLKVAITSQLSNPTTISDKVDFAIDSEMTAGDANSILGITIGKSGKLKQTGQPPSVGIAQAKLIGGDHNTGAGQFDILVECGRDVAMRKGFYRCGANPISEFRYTLVADNFNGNPCHSKDGPSGCEALMNQGHFEVDMNSELVLPGEKGLANGGLHLQIASGGILGPADMANNPEMILLFEHDGNYSWMNIDIQVTLGLALHQLALIGLEADNYELP